MDFEVSASKLIESLSKEEKKAFDAICAFESPQLASMGANDLEGVQIFTPEFVVKQMTEAVGKDVLDFGKTVLEPTSGDGAFTTFILKKRLDTIKDNFETNIGKALSTIYSIEMDEALIRKQRDNIFTVISLFVHKKKLHVDKSFFSCMKCIIVKNFIWAMFNTELSGGLIVEVAHKMPEAEKGKFKSVEFPVWNFTIDSISYHEEGVDVW